MSKRAASQSAAALDVATAESKRFRSALDECADEFLCAITFELPIEPVTAEDGHIYEKAAIEEWLKRNAKSPKTNQPMGTRLFPAVGVKNTIEKMVRSGALSGDKATEWQRKLSDMDLVAATKQKAEGGDVDAMMNLRCWYRFGQHGIAKDDAASFRYAKQAADAGDLYGLAMTGSYYAHGFGVEKKESLGSSMVTEAAMAGNDFACYVLGKWSAGGLAGLPKDAKRAVKWYRKMMESCTTRNLHDAKLAEKQREEAAAYLRRHGGAE